MSVDSVSGKAENLCSYATCEDILGPVLEDVVIPVRPIVDLISCFDAPKLYPAVGTAVLRCAGHSISLSRTRNLRRSSFPTLVLMSSPLENSGHYSPAALTGQS